MQSEISISAGTFFPHTQEFTMYESFALSLFATLIMGHTIRNCYMNGCDLNCYVHGNIRTLTALVMLTYALHLNRTEGYLGVAVGIAAFAMLTAYYRDKVVSL